MTIYRGPGGGGNATTDAEINALTLLTNQSAASADASMASASQAATSAGNAATSASGASTSASAASGSASTASTQATNASNSASAASTSASNASTSETNAANSASAAAASAASVNDANLVHKTGDETIGGIKTFSSTIVGSVSGNAATVTTNANLTGAITSVGNATSLGSFTSAQLAAALTNETGSGSNVFSTSPTLVTPTLGAASVTSITFDDLSVQNTAASPQITTIGATVAASALTITRAVISLAFRSTTLGSGAVTIVTGTPANLVVPSTATLGTVSAAQSRIVVLALNNAGTIELAVVNIAGGNDLSETGVISTTAIAGGSNTANVIYSTTARTGVAYRVVGYVESTQATAGTWATAPSTVQGVGGQALIRPSSGSMVRLNTGNGFGSTNTVIRRFTNVVTNLGADITYADSATLGSSFVINTSGVYAISYSDSFAGGSDMGLSLNSNQLSTGINSITVADRLAHSQTANASTIMLVSWTGYLIVGSIIRPHDDTNGTGSRLSLFTISRVS